VPAPRSLKLAPDSCIAREPPYAIAAEAIRASQMPNFRVMST
jgi:hypothetical protein